MAWPRKPARRKINATGRNGERTGRFVRLPHSVLFSNAYRALSPNARTLLIEIISIYNGDNNGSLYLSVRDAAARMGLADPGAASRAFDDLQEMGFIELTKDSSFRSGSSDTSRARCWRVTFERGPGARQATNDYQDREPKPKTAERKRMERGQKALKTYRKQRDRDRFPVMDSTTLDDFSAMGAGNLCRIPVPP